MPTSALVFSWLKAQRATASTPKIADAEREQDRRACAGTECVSRPSSKATQTPAVKPAIQAVTQGGTTTRPSARDAEAGHQRRGDHLACRVERREQVERQAEPQAARERRRRRPSAIAAPGGPSGRHG